MRSMHEREARRPAAANGRAAADRPTPGRAAGLSGLVLLGLLGTLLAGCGGPRFSASFLEADFTRYERDTRALAPTGPAREVLEAAEARKAEADRKKDRGLGLVLALADVRAALALADMERAERRADECRMGVQRERDSWDEALRLLIRAEQVARKTATGVPHDVPNFKDPYPDMPATSLDEGGTPPSGPLAVQTAWDVWLAAAFDMTVPVADLQDRYAAVELMLTDDSDESLDAAVHVAGRTVQELEARVRRATAVEVCSRALTHSAELAAARDAALRSTLELERGLADALRAQLEKTQAEAESRQQQIYDALRQLEGKFASIRREARGTIVSLADILFDFNKATLKRDVEFSLVRIATILNQFPEMKIQVEGHTDNVGRAEYNLDLSRRRAQAVHDFLVEQGVRAERMTVEGFGMTRPVADNGTPEGRQKNRRVDLVIEDAPGSSPAPATPSGTTPGATPVPGRP
jgi:outer membrane protein OmpA-like peptidoglycan-associated protein